MPFWPSCHQQPVLLPRGMALIPRGDDNRPLAHQTSCEDRSPIIFWSERNPQPGVKIEEIRNKRARIVNGDVEVNNGTVQKHTFCLNVCMTILFYGHSFTPPFRFHHSRRIRNKSMHTIRSVTRDAASHARNSQSKCQILWWASSKKCGSYCYFSLRFYIHDIFRKSPRGTLRTTHSASACLGSISTISSLLHSFLREMESECMSVFWDATPGTFSAHGRSGMVISLWYHLGLLLIHQILPTRTSSR